MLLEAWRIALDLVLILCGAAMLLAGLIVLWSSKPLELSVRSVSAILIAAWGAWKLAIALQPHEALSFLDVVGPLGVAMWISQAVFKHHHRAMRRFGDFTQVPGVRMASSDPRPRKEPS